MKDFDNIIPRVNISLVITGLLLGGYLFLSMSRPYHVGNLSSRQAAAAQPLNLAASAGIPDLDEGVFKKSELFRSSGKKAATQNTRSLMLIGVSMGAKKLAIIRDTKANKDYYCTEGDIAGNYKILEIHKDRVVLEYEGAVLEITR